MRNFIKLKGKHNGDTKVVNVNHIVSVCHDDDNHCTIIVTSNNGRILVVETVDRIIDLIGLL